MTDKPTRRQLAEQIELLVAEGMTAPEIGRHLGMSRERVIRIASQYRVRLQPKGGKRRLSGHFSGRSYEIITQLAARAGVSPGTMLVRIAQVVVEDGQQRAAQRLGRAALPKRPYVRKTA